MSFIAALLTFLFFCHPTLLALIAIVFCYSHVVHLCSGWSDGVCFYCHWSVGL